MSAAPAEEAVKDVPPATRPEAEAAQDASDLFGGLKKKSKKKKIPMDLDAELSGVRTFSVAASLTNIQTKSDDKLDNNAEGQGASASEEGSGALAGDTPLDVRIAWFNSTTNYVQFGDLKKKKKKKKAAFDLEEFEKELGEKNDEPKNELRADEDSMDMNPEGEVDADAETWQGTDRDYTYAELLHRIFRTLRQQNPALSGEKKKYTMVPPVVQRDGSKKTMFANVIEICKRMHRQPDHVIQYLFTELGTTGSVDGSQRLVIRGRFQPKQIENVLRRYIIEYVTCKTCRSPNTLLTKENRIFFMTCEACGSQRSVSAIKTGFQAQTGKRSKMRE